MTEEPKPLPLCEAIHAYIEDHKRFLADSVRSTASNFPRNADRTTTVSDDDFPQSTTIRVSIPCDTRGG